MLGTQNTPDAPDKQADHLLPGPPAPKGAHAVGGEPGRHGSFLQLRILLPFILVTLIWGSTWIVIRGQFGPVPAMWSVSYRFVIAAAAMFAWGAASGAALRIGREGHLLALAFGVPQFCLNFNLVYAAEHHVTSGLVAVVFALLLVPNAGLARLFLRHRMTPRFLAGSAVAIVGVGLLFVQEMRASGGREQEVALGIALTLVAVLAASSANVLQATGRLRARPIPAMVAWGMAYGALCDAALAFLFVGPPRFDTRWDYWAGLLYLGLCASALAFSLYYAIIRAVGPAKAAYSSLLVPILAMAFSTAFEGYRWSTPAVAGGVLALAGLFIALRSPRPATDG